MRKMTNQVKCDEKERKKQSHFRIKNIKINESRIQQNNKKSER